jgi:hypothetical protein
LGSGATGAVVASNVLNAASGKIGFIVGLMPPGTFAAGTQQMVTLSFASTLYSNNVPLILGNSPVVCQLADANANPIPATFQNATLAVGGAAWPALTINPAGSNVLLSWSSSAAAFNLATTPSLTAGWSNVAGPLTTNNGVISTTMPISTNQAFYRLQYP